VYLRFYDRFAVNHYLQVDFWLVGVGLVLEVGDLAAP
jgi:hypothetical protein